MIYAELWISGTSMDLIDVWGRSGTREINAAHVSLALWVALLEVKQHL
jgi:hypothetical protein